MRVSIIIISVLMFSVVGCTTNTSFEDESPQNGDLIQDQRLVSQIRSAQSSLMVNVIEFTVESYAWRDFMPIVDPPVRLNLNNTLIRTDGESIQSNIEIVKHYIVHEGKIWRPTEVEVRLNQSSPNRLNIISREGPIWEVGSKVNVGLKIKNQETGNIYWFSVPEVTIAETH